MTSQLHTAKYISLTSHRRNGTPVSTAVWVVPYQDGYAFTTDADSWKVKRVLADPRVTVQVCNVRGRPTKGAPVFQGRAEVLDASGVADVRLLIRSKYRIAYRLLIERSDRKAARREGSPTAGTAAIKVVLDD